MGEPTTEFEHWINVKWIDWNGNKCQMKMESLRAPQRDLFSAVAFMADRFSFDIGRVYECSWMVKEVPIGTPLPKPNNSNVIITD